MRRPAGGIRRSSLTIVPRDRSGDLPEWHPAEPRGGWTPTTGREAARAYAEEIAPVLGADPRRVARSAYRALRAAVPALHHADVVARLRGELSHDDAPAHHFSAPPAPF
ncbi:hypothetical protein [Agromyces indicus]|uniref:Uncharacterized protein n=1 Tax=Agromyces indicus TaxID=758919 RepID=A0ABU1FJC3_9MICO|nr:hypothetical protein [Agromyces indicus]MDR5691862.1 hypothetical protein [Agromyces indicus]